jgi:hypothetical protein
VIALDAGFSPFRALAAVVRCYEGTEASARAWLEVVCVAYLFVRLRAEPT